MVTETRFDSIFDFNSAFQYESFTPLGKSINRNQYKSAFSYHSINLDTEEDSDDVKEENKLSLVLRKTITLLLYIFVIISFPLSFWLCIKKVHALERIVLMRLGKLQPVRGPGYTFVLPLIDIWKRVDLRPQTFTISTPQLLTADGGIVEVQSEIEYRVSNVISYITKLSKQEKTLKDLGLCCLTNIISVKDQEDLETNKEFISCALKQDLNQSSLKWGLEILNVYLFSIKILKAAKPADALGTIMTALKAATGHSSEHATAVFPLIPDVPTHGTKEECFEDVSIKDNGTIDILKKVIANAESKGLLRDITASFKFNIVGNGTETVYCSFDNGHATMKDCESEADVSLIISEDNMHDFLEHKMTPIQAYMDGKVMVTGDWSLLRPLAKILEEPLSS